jgi:methane/ammonia monooxygenase subunit B
MNTSFFNLKRLGVAAALSVTAFTGATTDAFAHGERAQEPFLRMRSVHWYDTEWTKDTVAINDTMQIRGKVRFSPSWMWPTVVHKPDNAFLNIATTGPVFVRKAASVNGQYFMNGGSYELGHDYAYEMTLRARIPGTVHVHPMMSIESAGPLAGPGKYVTITGNRDAFENKVKTLVGTTIEMETYGWANVKFWHALWFILALGWLGYWVSKPLFFERYKKLSEGREDELVTPTDRLVSIGALVAGVGITIIGGILAESDVPVHLPLQTARAHFYPMPAAKATIDLKLERATYRVPGRAMEMKVTVTNNTASPVRLGEFATASVRFINPKVGYMDELSKAYPDYLKAENGLTISDNNPIAPGETRTIDITAQDAAWETERLSSLIYDPDSAFGGLLFFYDAEGKRSIVNVGGVLVPQFV